MKKFWLAVRTLVVSSLTIVALGSETFAQEPKWEIEGHAGFSFASFGPSGVSALPPAGETTGTNPGTEQLLRKQRGASGASAGSGDWLQTLPPSEPDADVSFSGPPISNFRTFQGNGLEADFTLTVGGYWRFQAPAYSLARNNRGSPFSKWHYVDVEPRCGGERFKVARI